MGFRPKILLRLAGIMASVLLLTWLLLNTRFYITMTALGILLVLQVVALLRYVSTTNQELSRFLGAVRHSDFSQSFRSHLPGSDFQELGQAFDDVLERFRSERSEKEDLASYLQIFIQQIPIAVLCLDEDGRINISNSALRKLIAADKPITNLRQVYSFSPGLSELIETLQPGAVASLKIAEGQRRLHLKVSCSILRTKGRQQKLVSIQDIQGELEAQELEAWQNLIQVMTHEIMNSIAPIVSLTDTAGRTLRDAQELAATYAEGHEIGALLDDAAAGLDVIGSRSQGLLRFVDSYRSLARLPNPIMQNFPMGTLLQSVERLMAARAQAQNTLINYCCIPENLSLNADQALLEQALINLVKNALDAVQERENGRVEVNAELKGNGRIWISVSDNGEGIRKENLKNVFVPFFTTKRNGTGIGMSIVRQIAILHGGSVNLESVPGEGTTVLVSL